MINLYGKQILLFVPNGRGIYGTGILSELERRGAKVTIFDERPSSNTISKVALRLAKKQMGPFLRHYFMGIVKRVNHIKFDYIFFIRGEGLTPSVIKSLRSAFPSAIFILYLWDSLKSNDTRKVLCYFDKVLSFDLRDTQTYSGIIHRPLFFLPEYRRIALLESQDEVFDVVFIGTIHNDRLSFVQKLKTVLNEAGFTTFFYFYFPSRLLFVRKKLTDPSFKNIKLNDFNYKRISAQEAASILARSRASLDIEGPGQSGLTMRTIEVLGSNRKLITTNRIIQEYDFYNPQNIFIIDRNNPKLDFSFIRSPYVPIDPIIYGSYSIEGWVEAVFK